MSQFYLIGSAAKQDGLSSQTVRDYCRRGRVKPLRDSAGHRLFTNEDIRRIREVYLVNMTRCPQRAGAV